MPHPTEFLWIMHLSNSSVQWLRIEERETQLTQQSPDGLPVTLTTEEVDRIFEEVQLKIFVYINFNILT